VPTLHLYTVKAFDHEPWGTCIHDIDTTTLLVCKGVGLEVDSRSQYDLFIHSETKLIRDRLQETGLLCT
jgi:hypothetical protein